MTTTILPIVAASAFVLITAYVWYGRLIVRWFGIDPSRPTPAVTMEDGNDYVPAPAGVVLGGHFTAIAAAGPVVGPILAGLYFGWLPALIWIVLGAIFIGGVHDSGSLFASIRHKATSITQVVREHMSRTAYVTFLAFVWISLVYVIIAFADVTAGTFANFVVEQVNVQGQVQPVALNGGAVVIGATAYLVLSITLGLLLRFTKTPWYVGLIGSVVILSLCIWRAPAMANWLADNGMTFMNTQAATPGEQVERAGALTKSWDQALLVYCFIASITPMWLLLQPRGVIGATFLYAALLIGIAGAVAGGFNGTGELKISWPAFTGFYKEGVGYLFPFLFITIACGACSGFHSIVASGTTSKQIRSEKDLKPVGYGSMLLESMVAVFSLASVMILIPETNTLSKPDTIYAMGMGRFASQLHPGVFFFFVSFGLLAFSSFVFDTLDVCTRLGRYVFQEITGLKGIAGGAIATLITLAGPSIYLWSSPPGSFRTFWTIFGTSNQLLASLTLVGVSVWLWRTGRPVWFVLIPAIFMAITTGTALVFNFMKFLGDYRVVPANASGAPSIANMIIAAVLFGLGSLVVFEALRVWVMTRTRVMAPVIAGK